VSDVRLPTSPRGGASPLSECVELQLYAWCLLRALIFCLFTESKPFAVLGLDFDWNLILSRIGV